MKPKFTKAIVRTPCRALVEGITTANLGLPDYELALEQHHAYVEALRTCGLEVDVLPAEERFPDSTFIEDVAVCTRDFAMITFPAPLSRYAEKELIGVALRKHFKRIEIVTFPGKLEGGDVMMVGDLFYIGWGAGRTDAEGATQLIHALRRHFMNGEPVYLEKVLHLKTAVSYLEDNRLLVHGDFADLPVFQKFERIVVDADEAYAANCVWINDKVLVPAGFPKTLAKIQGSGCETIVLEMSEFQKIDGGLSCLSLRF